MTAMLPDILGRTYLDNRLLDYLVALGLFVAGLLALKVINSIVLSRLRKWAERTRTTLDDFVIEMVERTILPLLSFGILLAALHTLTLSDYVSRGVQTIAAVLITFYGVRFLIALVTYTLRLYVVNRAESPETREVKERSLKGIMSLLKAALWGLGVVFLLDNLGFEVSAVLAGLGIGGIAIALAAQAILGDLFSYLCILFDRPFEIGDFVIVGDYLGTIEYIGIKTTRIRSLGGEQLIFSNTDLTGSRIKNYKRMERRRVLFQVGVTYQTSLAQIKAAPNIIKEIIEDVEDTVFDRSHFSTFADCSLQIETVYYVLSSDYNKYMDIQQQINFRIKEAFEQAGLEFAYPTQTVFLENTGAGAS